MPRPTTPLAAALARALKANPCTVRALAREAGVSATLLGRIATGRRGATPAVALKVAGALERWGVTAAAAARAIRKAVREAAQH